MKQMLAGMVCLVMLVTAAAQEKKKMTAEKAGQKPAAAALLESKIRKAWEDYKNRNKQAFAAILANGFGEVTNDGEGISDKEAELADMDNFNLAQYKLSDFKLRPVGNSGAVMTYTAEYGGSYSNAPIQMKALY